MRINNSFDPKNIQSISIKFLQIEKKNNYNIEVIYGKEHTFFFLNFDNYKSLKLFYNNLSLAIESKSNNFSALINEMSPNY